MTLGYSPGSALSHFERFSPLRSPVFRKLAKYDCLVFEIFAPLITTNQMQVAKAVDIIGVWSPPMHLMVEVHFRLSLVPPAKSHTIPKGCG